MRRCSEITAFMEELAPRNLAEEWDNTGLLVGNTDSSVERIMLCLDVTNDSVEKALELEADLIIAHHPVIFKGLKQLTEGEPKGRILYSLIRGGVNVFAAHTNLDFAVSGVNTQLAAVLGVNDAAQYGEGPGKTGYLGKRMSLAEFTDHVKNALNTPYVRIVGEAEQGINKVAIFCGSFDDNLEAVQETGADVLVTGELKYHTALDAREAGLCIVEAGHFSTERIVLPVLERMLKERFPDLEVVCYRQETDPFKTY